MYPIVINMGFGIDIFNPPWTLYTDPVTLVKFTDYIWLKEQDPSKLAKNPYAAFGAIYTDFTSPYSKMKLEELNMAMWTDDYLLGYKVVGFQKLLRPGGGGYITWIYDLPNPSWGRKDANGNVISCPFEFKTSDNLQDVEIRTKQYMVRSTQIVGYQTVGNSSYAIPDYIVCLKTPTKPTDYTYSQLPYNVPRSHDGSNFLNMSSYFLMYPGAVLVSGESLVSGNYMLVLQRNGVLALYYTPSKLAVWSLTPSSFGFCQATLLTTGLVITRVLDNLQVGLISSSTGVYLKVYSNGSLRMEDYSSGAIVWSAPITNVKGNVRNTCETAMSFANLGTCKEINGGFTVGENVFLSLSLTVKPVTLLSAMNIGNAIYVQTDATNGVRLYTNYGTYYTDWVPWPTGTRFNFIAIVQSTSVACYLDGQLVINRWSPTASPTSVKYVSGAVNRNVSTFDCTSTQTSVRRELVTTSITPTFGSMNPRPVYSTYSGQTNGAQYTISINIQTPSSTSTFNQCIFYHGANGVAAATGRSPGVFIRSGAITVSHDSLSVTTTILPLNTWLNLTFVVNQKTMTVYIDGILNGTATSSTPLTWPTGTVNASFPSGEDWKWNWTSASSGNIGMSVSNMYFWPVALSASDLLPVFGAVYINHTLSPLQISLLSGKSYGEPRTVTWNKGTLLSVASTTIEIGTKSVNMNVIPAVLTGTPKKYSISFDLFINGSLTPDKTCILRNNSDALNIYVSTVSGVNRLFIEHPLSATTTTSSSTTNDNYFNTSMWFNVICTVDNRVANVYINSTLVSSTTFSSAISSWNSTDRWMWNTTVSGGWSTATLVYVTNAYIFPNTILDSIDIRSLRISPGTQAQSQATLFAGGQSLLSSSNQALSTDPKNADDSALAGTDAAYTMSFDINTTTAYTTTNTLIVASSNFPKVAITSSNKIILYSGTLSGTTTGAVPTDGTRTTVSWTVNGTAVRIFINGVSDTTFTGSLSAWPSSVTWSLPAITTGSVNISNLYFWPYLLDDSDIKSLYVPPVCAVNTYSSTGSAPCTPCAIGSSTVGQTGQTACRAYVVRTLAGSGTPTFADGNGTSASFSYPAGVAVDTSGNVYVADYYNHRIRKVSPSGTVATLAGSVGGFADGTGTDASFNYPFGVAVDTSGNVYVGDHLNHRIRKVSPSGTVTTLAGNGSATFADGNGTDASFFYPYGVAVDTSGNVYVADFYNHRIRRIVISTGEVTTLAGSGTPTFADGNGTSASFSYPAGVAVDTSGNVYVADYYNHRIRKVSPSGTVTTLAGSVGGFADGNGTSASFNYPFGVAVDTSGNVYVGEKTGNRIRKVTSTGVVTTLAGTGSAAYNDSTGESASFNSPSGVAVDTSGNVYVADYSTHRIRIISA